MFDKLFEIAKCELTSINETVAGLPARQVTVLFSDNNNYYVAANDVDGLICEELKNNNDTKIINMLTMWKGNHIDFASFKFRKALIELDASNCDTTIMLQGKDGYIFKKLSVTVH